MPEIIALTLPYAKYSFERALEGISKAGYQHVGFRTGLGAAHAGEPIAKEMTPQQASRIRRQCEEYGLKVGTLFGADVLKEDIESLKRHIDFAQDVGAESVLWLGTWGYVRFPNEPHPEDHMKQLHEEYLKKIKPVAAHAEERNVVITLKPHTGNTATGPILRQTIDEIGSPFVQASYDPGNVYYYEGIDPEEGIDDVRDVSFSLVMKDHHKGPGPNQASLPGDGRVDFVHIIRRLVEVGFKGPLIVEKVHGEKVDGALSPEEFDQRMARALTNVLKIAEQAGYPSS